MRKHKGLKITGLIAAIILAVSLACFFFLNRMIDSMEAGNGQVADYETRTEIWGTVPGNSPACKLDDMNIDETQESLGWQTLKFMEAIVGEEYKDEEENIDTFTYLYEIKNGYERETYEDEPYLIPYTVPKSKGAIIVIPGGGFAYKSMDGTTGEGKDIALELNQAGYSAFVLHYRSNPYTYPYPQLDVQRAVRYLRYHADEYGLDPDTIGLIGFSAGGNQVGTYINCIMGNDLFPDDYIPDEIDQMDDTVTAPAMIYPALSYRFNVPMLFSMFDDEEVRDPSIRVQLLNATDLKQHINPQVKNQFISYGTSDRMVGTEETMAYIKAAKDADIQVNEVAAENQDHGYGFEYYGDAYIAWLNEVFSSF